MTEEELKALLRHAFLEGYNDGRVDGANIVMGQPFGGDEGPKAANLYIETFFVKDKLAKKRPFLRKGSEMTDYNLTFKELIFILEDGDIFECDKYPGVLSKYMNEQFWTKQEGKDQFINISSFSNLEIKGKWRIVERTKEYYTENAGNRLDLKSNSVAPKFYDCETSHDSLKERMNALEIKVENFIENTKTNSAGLTDLHCRLEDMRDEVATDVYIFDSKIEELQEKILHQSYHVAPEILDLQKRISALEAYIKPGGTD